MQNNSNVNPEINSGIQKKKKRKKILLFLCTGNTCRSPMAAAYMRKLLGENKFKNIEVRTAGVMTAAGLIPTTEVIQIMDAVGIDLRRHRSTKMTPEILKKADLILGMTPLHVQCALRMAPEVRAKTFLLKEYTGSDAKHAQIADPMGCTLEVYKKVFGEIKTACQKLLKSEFVTGKKKPGTDSEETPNKKTPVRKASISTREGSGKTQNKPSKTKKADSVKTVKKTPAVSSAKKKSSPKK